MTGLTAADLSRPPVGEKRRPLPYARPNPAPAQHQGLPAQPERDRRARSTAVVRRGAALLAGTTVVTGIANYSSTILMAHLLSARQFSVLAAGQSLLLVLGTGSMAALPWAVSHYLVDPDGERSRAKAMHFGLAASAALGIVLGLAALAVAWSVNGATFAGTISLGVLFICVLAGPVGFFQGENRLGIIAAIRLTETAVRIAAAFLLVLAVSRSAASGLLGFGFGSVAALTFAVWKGRNAFPLRMLERKSMLDLLRRAAMMGGVQVLLAMISALDTVYAAGGRFSAVDAASYQTAALIGRIPLFVSAALSTAAFTSLVTAQTEALAGATLRSCLRNYAWLTFPFVVGCISLRNSLLFRIVPPQYTDVPETLRLTCLIGAAIGTINIITTAHQARGVFRNPMVILTIGVATQAAVLIVAARLTTVVNFAALGLGVVATTTAFLFIDGRRWFSVTALKVRPRTFVLIAAGAFILFIHAPNLHWVMEIIVLAAGSTFVASTDLAPAQFVRSLKRKPIAP